MLTRKQHELLSYIHRYLSDHGVSPSFDEMKEALDLKSKSGIHRLITGLEERGFIRRLPHRARALEILKLPDATVPHAAHLHPEDYGPKVVTASFARNRKPGPAVAPPAPPQPQPQLGHMDVGSSPSDGDTREIPLLGRIAAGTPIAALRQSDRLIDVPEALLAGGEHYALEVSGDSMIDAGIFDGDTILIKSCNTAENGVIIVALIDEEEVTLKRLRRKGKSVALEAANSAFETRIFGPDRVEIQGRLVGLMRRY